MMTTLFLLYVVDMLIVGQNSSLKKQLSKSFAMKDLGPAKQILGMKIEEPRNYGCHKRSTLRKYFKGLEWRMLKRLVVLLLITLN